MATYLSLEDAAKKLGITTDKLVDLRSQGEVRGFRDGTSWKFPENEIERLSDELAASGGDSTSAQGAGSDLGIGGETPDSGSGPDNDVNVVPSKGEGSDVGLVSNESVTSDSELLMENKGDDLLEIDSADLQLNEPAIQHDSADIDVSVEPNSGSTGPVTDEELEEIAESNPDVMEKKAESPQAESNLNLGEESAKKSGGEGSDLGFSGLSQADDEDSGEVVLGGDDDSEMDVLGSDTGGGGASGKSGASSLELMGELEEPKKESRGDDVLSELDLLSKDQESGLVSGDSENLLASSGLGSSVGADNLKDSDVGGLDDALADDDDLIIADDDDDLVISNAGSDISVAGDSGINLMSPSDSGLSLESEPLDLAGSSISALDLGSELSEGGSGSGSGSDPAKSDGSMVDFQSDEEFQLSPSGIGLDADVESGSQVIEVEDSEAVGEPVEFDEAAEAEPLGGDVFGEPAEGEALAVDEEGEEVAIDDSTAPAAPGRAAAYEIPFSMLQCVSLVLVLCIMSLGGMLMTDLVRNLWTYTEPSAPVSSLTDALIGLMGWGT